MTRVVSDAGHDANDDRGALAALATSRLEVVVADARLPVGEGLELVRRVRRELPSTEVVLLTSPGPAGAPGHDPPGGPVDAAQLVALVERLEGGRGAPAAPSSLVEAMNRCEKELLERALRGTGDRKLQTAHLLGISRKSLWKKLTKYGLQKRRPGDNL